MRGIRTCTGRQSHESKGSKGPLAYLDAYVYLMNRGRKGPPPPGYLFTCLRGAVDWCIPATALLDPIALLRNG